VTGPDRHEVDVVVVGGGAAGLAAASWIGRYRRSVVVVDSEDPRNKQVDVSHGYLGRDPQKPADLLAKGPRGGARLPDGADPRRRGQARRAA
jgi:thioredoxin reductase